MALHAVGPPTTADMPCPLCGSKNTTGCMAIHEESCPLCRGGEVAHTHLHCRGCGATQVYAVTSFATEDLLELGIGANDAEGVGISGG